MERIYANLPFDLPETTHDLSHLLTKFPSKLKAAMNVAGVLGGQVKLADDVYSGFGSKSSFILIICLHYQMTAHCFARRVPEELRNYETWKGLVENTWLR